MSRIASDFASSPHIASHEDRHLSGDAIPAMQHLCLGKLPKVAIIGAGVSGLRCADLLAHAGASVTIFEARNRIGGRVHQVDNGGYLVDTGSNWIHGTVGNPIMRLAELTQTQVMEPQEAQVVFDTQGQRRSNKESNRMASTFWEWILNAFKHSDENSATIDSQKSLLDWLKEEWSKKFANEKAFVHDMIEESRMWGQFVGSPIEHQSFKFFWLEEGLDGDNVFVAGTYAKILEAIAQPALAKADLKLNTEVTHIQYRTDDKDENPVTITTADDTTHEFDEVVVTLPLGWLKRNAAECFTPLLPPRLTQAIDNIGYGALEKLYVTFPRAFWLGHSESYPCFTNFHNPTGYHPMLTNVPSSSSEPSSQAPQASNISATTSWNQSVVALSHLPAPSNQPTLLFYMTGDAGAHLTSLIASQNLIPHSQPYDDLLNAFAQPFYSRLPNYHPASPECTPTAFYQTIWQTDKYAGYGSYSTFRVGLEQGDKDLEVMRDTGGIGGAGRGLWFAGEHTAPFVALGTTTGAWWSGEGAARRVAARYGLKIEVDEGEEEGQKTEKESGSEVEDYQDWVNVSKNITANGGMEKESV